MGSPDPNDGEQPGSSKSIATSALEFLDKELLKSFKPVTMFATGTIKRLQTLKKRKQVEKERIANRRRKIIEAGTFRCEYCSFKGGSNLELVNHKKRHMIAGKLKYACLKCQYKTPNKAHLKQHKDMHLEVKFPCEVDDCAYVANFKTHLMKHHKDVHAEKKPEELFACKVDNCAYVANFKTHLMKHHKDMHAEKKPEELFACEVDDCTYVANFKTHVRTHYKATHTEVKPFSCDVDKCFFASSSLTAFEFHKQKHSINWTGVYICDLCDYETAFLQSITNHRQTHTDARPYQCEQCGYSFRHKSSLTYHMKGQHK